MPIRTSLVAAIALTAPAFAQTPPTEDDFYWSPPLVLDGPPAIPPEQTLGLLQRDDYPELSTCLRQLNQTLAQCRAAAQFHTPVFKPATPSPPCNKTDSNGDPAACLYLLDRPT